MANLIYKTENDVNPIILDIHSMKWIKCVDPNTCGYYNIGDTIYLSERQCSDYKIWLREEKLKGLL